LFPLQQGKNIVNAAIRHSTPALAMMARESLISSQIIDTPVARFGSCAREWADHSASGRCKPIKLTSP
jgi:hypothetical protein